MKLTQQLKLTQTVIVASLIVVGTALILLLVVVTGSKPSTLKPPATSNPVQAAREAAITITPQGFVPATLKVSPGTKVTWTNQDASPHQIASDPHPTHTGLNGLESISLTQNSNYSFTFNQPGTYTYHDHLNPYKLKGTVVVE